MKELAKACIAGAILGGALFSVSAARAGDLFYTTNQAGGAIVLTDSHAGCGRGVAYYSTDGGTVVAAGCWTVSDPFVIGTDINGVQHRWLISGFAATEYGRAKMSRAGSM